jgi:hypothetical protein
VLVRSRLPLPVAPGIVAEFRCVLELLPRMLRVPQTHLSLAAELLVGF